MRYDWIDDILAVLETGSLASAAAKRHVTQSAFTRRVKTIEENLNVDLFDRSKKPVDVLPHIKTLEGELRDLRAAERSLLGKLRAGRAAGHADVSFVCQHSLTTTIAASLVRALRGQFDMSVKLSSGNQDECMLQLISKSVDFSITYDIPAGSQEAGPSAGFWSHIIATDELIPVVSSKAAQDLSSSTLPLISYPSDVFLGKVLASKIVPLIAPEVTLVPMAETALTIAMHEMVRSNLGLAWLPRSLCQGDLKAGVLMSLADRLPVQDLNIILTRHTKLRHGTLEGIWEYMTEGAFAL